MPGTAEDIQLDLKKALDSFDWPAADALVNELRVMALRDQSSVSPRIAKDVLSLLREKCRLSSMGSLAQTFLAVGIEDAQVRRQMAQALIDQGHYYSAEMALNSILTNAGSSPKEKSEAQGLTGRVYKQLYVNACKTAAPTPQAAQFLGKAIDRYAAAYLADPINNHWQGINHVALVQRAVRDAVPLADGIDGLTIAAEIRDRLEAADALDTWQRATLVECYVALGDPIGAFRAAKSYVSDTSLYSFQVGGMLRQMEEIWQLGDDNELGKQLLPLLRSVLLQSRDGGLKMTPAEAKDRLQNATRTQVELEAIHGSDSFQSVKWYRDGLERCKSVALIRKRGGVGFGTAWLVNASDFFEGETGQLLLTNAHVVGEQGALRPEDAQATFDMVNDTPIDIDSVFRWSPINKFDAAFLKLKGPAPGIEAMPLAEKAVIYEEQRPARLYVIGHPNGGDLAFSLQDNRLLGANEVRLHYRTPTTGGSSGSPVFEENGWRVVALHHGGGNLARLDDDTQTYAANEGISIHAIQRAAREGKLS